MKYKTKYLQLKSHHGGYKQAGGFFDQLPPEIQQLIASSLSPKDIINLRLLSKEQSSILLKTLISTNIFDITVAMKLIDHVEKNRINEQNEKVGTSTTKPENYSKYLTSAEYHNFRNLFRKIKNVTWLQNTDSKTIKDIFPNLTHLELSNEFSDVIDINHLPKALVYLGYPEDSNEHYFSCIDLENLVTLYKNGSKKSFRTLFSSITFNYNISIMFSEPCKWDAQLDKKYQIDRFAMPVNDLEWLKQINIEGINPYDYVKKIKNVLTLNNTLGKHIKVMCPNLLYLECEIQKDQQITKDSFSESLKTLIVINSSDFNYKFEVPLSLKKLYCRSGQSCLLNPLPQSLEILHFVPDKKLIKGVLPENLIELEFLVPFGNFDEDAFPNKLRTLKGIHITSSLDEGILPNSLKTLSISGTDNIQQLKLPQSLTTLYMNFNLDTIVGVLPKTLEELHLSGSVRRIYDTDFPQSLRILDMSSNKGWFGFYYNSPKDIVFPKSLQRLRFGPSINPDITEGYLPDSLQYQEFGPRFGRGRIKTKLPKSLTHLVFSDKYVDFAYINPAFIPESLQTIDFKIDEGNMHSLQYTESEKTRILEKIPPHVINVIFEGKYYRGSE